MRLARVEPDAFGVLYRRYAGEVEGFVNARVGGNRAVAQDIAGSTFAKALAALPHYTVGPFRGWIYQIARNAVIDHHRRKKPVASLDGILHLASDAPSPVEQAIAADQRTRLHAAMAQLDARQREIVTWRLHGYTAAEIGERLGMSADAVKSAQHRAFRKIRSVLGDRP